ncbi:MAG: hypothetical protein EXX96DRAFT_378113 [Benjaminiella poitrasii]|nr:MAG: hypothetical protein EXX96DRAFT_378113 [Benjaminiella poitrasii]
MCLLTSRKRFLLNYRDSIADAYVDSELSLKYHGNTYKILELKDYKRKIDSSSNKRGKKNQTDQVNQDAATYRTHTILYTCERNTKENSKHQPDLVKIATKMKDCLDSVLRCGIPFEEIHLVGLFIEGTLCTVLILDLPTKNSYRLIVIDTFTVPRKL